MPHATDNARYAAGLITRGPIACPSGWERVIVGGFCRRCCWPLDCPVAAGLLALAGLLMFEWCFIMAGQSVPNS
jgi:hypothetical protein